MIHIEVKGLDTLIRQLNRLGRDATVEMAAALYEEGSDLLTESKMEVPVDTGALRASGYVTSPEIGANSAKVTVGYGGVAGPGKREVGYALWVHERLGVKHPVGKAKYLEDPAVRRAKTMGERIRAKLVRLLERVIG